MNIIYVVKKNIEKLEKGQYTCFLNPNICREISYKLKKEKYSIYYYYPECEKVILYVDKIPKISLIKIESYLPLTHREILGSLFGLNINEEFFGDIIIDQNEYYFYVMEEIKDFILNNLIMIGNKKVKLKEVNVNYLNDYKRKYETYEFIVSSLRLDTVIAKIIGCNRDKIKDKIHNKEIVVNYNIINSSSYIFKEGDIFSIKKYGKYKFKGIVKTTKKDNYIVRCWKYV